jgi:glycosyltransferase involved in cell wall biosynthesis
MDKQKVVFLGFTIPEELANDYFRIDPNPAIQTYKFAWSFARSLAIYNEVILVSSIPIQNYPLVDKLFIKGGGFKSQGFNGYFIPFINILLLKHFFRLFFGFFVLLYVCILKKPEVIFVHGVHTPYLILANLFKFFGFKFAIVLTDPAGVELDTDSLLSRYLKKIDKFVINFFVNNADILISLAPKLVENYNKKNIKLNFPGILNKDFNEGISAYQGRKTESHTFKVVYAGGLHEIYGIKKLVDSILEFPADVKIKMLFLGKGDQLEYIKQCSKDDSRVEYGGFLSNEELIPELLNADLLINPRPTSLEFTGLSFPSKLIEYLATGTPILTTRISSIPSCYEEFFYYIDDESGIGIQQAILRVMETDPIERNLVASRAQNFIQQEASEVAVGEKINYMTKQLLRR